MTTIKTTPLNVKEFELLDLAINAANAEATSTSGRCVPMTIFRQGRRYMMSGAFPFGFIRDICTNSPAKRGATISALVDTALNRPLIAGHSPTIAKYIRELLHGDFILGALTLNISRPINFYTLRTDSEQKMGYLVIPYGTKIDTTDGGHRSEAIRLCFQAMSAQELEEFNRQSIAVVIVADNEVKQIHQDFADASKGRALPAALLTVFDQRNPANTVVTSLEQSCPVFTGLIDATSKSISKSSKNLFTANHLRQFVKVMITGSWQLGTADFDEKAKQMFKDAHDLNSRIDEILLYLNSLTQAIPEWKQIAELPDRMSPEFLAKHEGFRAQKRVSLCGSGLIILARIGYELFYKHANDITSRGETWQIYVGRLTNIDWSCEAEFWKGNVCQPDAKGQMKVVQQQNLIRQAVNNVKEAIGLTFAE